MKPDLLPDECDGADHPRTLCPGMFKHAVRNAVCDGEKLHKMLLMSLTTRPVSHQPVALMWMQRDPGAWAGWHPEECANVAQIMGATTEV
jgi:hypothetical protein